MNRFEARRTLLWFFGIWYALCVLVVLASPDRLAYLGPLSIGGVFFVFARYRHRLQTWAQRIPVRPSLRFLGVGLLFNGILMENLAISFRGDLHPNLLLNTLLWMGPYLGALLAWLALSRFYSYSALQVLVAAGLKGVLIEQNFLMIRALATGAFGTALFGIPLIFVTYGAPMAVTFLVSPPADEGRRSRPALFMLLGIVLPILGFYLAGWLWISGLKRFVT